MSKQPLNETKTHLMYFIFTGTDLQLIRNACIGMKYQTSPVFITIVYDILTPKEILEYLYSFKFDEYIMAPEEYSLNIALKTMWAYAQSQYRYVAFCQWDDQPFISRIAIQRKAMETSPKPIGISFTSFFYVINKDIKTAHRDTFSYTPRHLFNVGYPSFWMLDKSRVHELPRIEGFIGRKDWEWDLYMLIEILKKTEGLILREALGVYNQHQTNNTAITDPSIIKSHFDQLCEDFKKEKPFIKNLYEIEMNGNRNDGGKWFE